MNTTLEQDRAYATELWWEYLRGNIAGQQAVNEMSSDAGVTTTAGELSYARVARLPLIVAHDSGAAFILPQPY